MMGDKKFGIVGNDTIFWWAQIRHMHSLLRQRHRRLLQNPTEHEHTSASYNTLHNNQRFIGRAIKRTNNNDIHRSIFTTSFTCY